MSDAFGRAIRDWYHDAMDEPLVYRDGAETSEHPIEEYYFGEFQDGASGAWLERWLDGPLIDLEPIADRVGSWLQRVADHIRGPSSGGDASPSEAPGNQRAPPNQDDRNAREGIDDQGAPRDREDSPSRRGGW
jgi:hypothetical protein